MALGSRWVWELGVRQWSGSRELEQDLGRVCCSEIGWGVGGGDGALRARGRAREHPGWEELTSE